MRYIKHQIIKIDIYTIKMETTSRGTKTFIIDSEKGYFDAKHLQQNYEAIIEDLSEEETYSLRELTQAINAYEQKVFNNQIK
jgi:hypothetical protein